MKKMDNAGNRRWPIFLSVESERIPGRAESGNAEFGCQHDQMWADFIVYLHDWVKGEAAFVKSSEND